MNVPRETRFWEGQSAQLVQAWRDVLRDEQVAARYGRTIELAAVEAQVPLSLAEPTEQALVPLRMPDETCADSFATLVVLVRERSPAVDHAWGPYLEDTLHAMLAGSLAAAVGLDSEQAVSFGLQLMPDRIHRFLPDNPIVIVSNREGIEANTKEASRRHRLQIADYFASLRPPGRLGRPPKDEELAAKVYARDCAGEHWTEIIRDLLPGEYDLYDKADKKRASARFRRLRERGGILKGPETS